ncbi:MAG: TetR/AcrR family transcriptional regulator [Bacteroidia bacterium]
MSTAYQTIDRPRQILQAATQLFAEKGYPQVSMRQLGQAVGIKSATLYHHFPSKEALLQALTDHVAQRFFAALEPLTQKPKETSVLLEEMIICHTETLLEDPAQATIFLREWRYLPQPAKTHYENRQKAYEQLFEKVLIRGMTENLFRAMDTRFVTLSLLAALNATATWFRPQGNLQPKEIGQKLAEIWLYGLIRNY